MPSPFSSFSDPGNTTGTALDTTSASYIGGSLTSSPNIFKDSLGGSDTTDVYKFTLSSSTGYSIVNLNLSGLTDNADLDLLNSSGFARIRARTTGTTSESIRTTLANGTYYARAYLPTGSTGSTNYDLSLSAEDLQQRAASDNTLATAVNIGTINGASPTYTDSVSSAGDLTDGNDYYQFNVTGNGIINVNLTGLGANTSLDFLNSSGTTLQTQSGSAGTPININRTLSNGIYYIRVYPGSNSVTNYNLNLTFTPEPADNAGNSLLAARDITGFTNTPYTDYVSSADNLDYYKFVLTSDSLVNFSLSPTEATPANATLKLLNSTGGSIQNSLNSGVVTQSINRSLVAGTYYLLVEPGTTSPTNYNLSASAITIPADQAPNTRLQSKDLQTLAITPISVQEFVGNIDNNDYYKFNLNNSAAFTLNLTGLPNNANTNVQLFDGTGSFLQIGTFQDGSLQIKRDLSAGTYYIQIYAYSGVNGFYNLTLSAAQKAQIINLSGAVASDPQNLTAWDNSLYFTAKDNNGLEQLWKSNGTLATTTKLTSFTIAQNSNITGLTVWNNQIYFTADGGDSYGRELWVSNGTSATRVSDINPNTASSNPGNFTAFNNKLYFTATNSAYGTELWVYDGSNPPTRVSDISIGAASSNIANLTVFSNKLYFSASDSTSGTELWSYDGTTVQRVADINPGAGGSAPASLAVIGSNLFFTADNGTNGDEIWVYNGTGTPSLVKNITPDNIGFSPIYLTAFNNALYFVADSNGDFNQELWKTDGTSGGTQLVRSDLIKAPNIGFGPINLKVVGDTLYFTTYDSTTGLELWKTDGSDGGTTIVKDIFTGNNASNKPNSSIPDYFVNFNGRVYFTAFDTNTSKEIWTSDGTAANTLKVSSINTTASSDPRSLTVLGGRLFFTATDGTNGRELWVI